MSGKDEEPPKRVIVQVKRARRLGIDLTLTTPRDWLPDARNGRLVFTARIYEFKSGKWEYPGEARQITFSFTEVSKEGGVCMNYPIKDKNNITPASTLVSNTNPDLFFPEDDKRMKDFYFDEDETDGDADKKCPTEILKAKDNPAHEHHYKKASTKKPVTEAKVVVRCEDYGAFGVLTAEAEDCETIPPRENDAEPSEGIGPNDVKIPRDDNGNNIADSAAQDKNKDGSKALPDKDEDDVPHSTNHKGDGLTNYEEYRGFIVKEGKVKKHKRTDINNKDVFIHDVNDLKTGNFSASGLTVHRIPGPEFYNGDSNHDNEDEPKPADRQIINFNRTSHSIRDQHGLRLKNKTFGGNFLGYTYAPLGDVNWPTYPKFCNFVAVDRALLRRIRPRGRLAQTIAHELGHAVHIVHHGEEDICPVCNHCRAGSQTSGNVSCVMRYGPNYDSVWCHDHGGACHNHAVPNPEAVATQFCDSSPGTGCNVGGAPCNFNNDAIVGNCIGQIIVKDPP